MKAPPCPHCKKDSIVRSSVPVSETVREGKMMCINPDCGFVGVFQMAVIRTIRPSSTPDEKVKLPYSRKAHDNLQRSAQMCIFD